MHFAGRLMGMPKSVQIRNVPDDIHRELRIRAAEAGMSLSDYLREELLPLLAKPRIAEVIAESIRENTGTPDEVGDALAAFIREERDSRFRSTPGGDSRSKR